jgi:hypothetical protein
MSAPRLPHGDQWVIETVNYDGPKTMFVAWARTPPGRSWPFHVASKTFRPRFHWAAFWLVYINGLSRLANDRRADKRSAKDRMNVAKARAVASSDTP